LLLKTPQIGRPGRVAGARELVIGGTVQIVPYRLHSEDLQILRVYHSARLWPESFE
jgi:plasmid stabilization system protein ParE